MKLLGKSEQLNMRRGDEKMKEGEDNPLDGCLHVFRS